MDSVALRQNIMLLKDKKTRMLGNKIWTYELFDSMDRGMEYMGDRKILNKSVNTLVGNPDH